MLIEDLSRLDEAYLRQACDDKFPESGTLDFKRDLPSSSEKDKHELLKDVCALANAEGGDLVYGVAEVDGTAESLAPLSLEPTDSAVRRLAQVLDAGLEPRVQGLRFRHIGVAGGYVLVIRVPASFAGPHCIRMNSNRRFVIRNGTSTSDMTYEQIRTAFDRTATLAEKARSFISARRELVAARKTATPVEVGPVWVIHLVPIEGIAERRTVDLHSLSNGSFVDFSGRGWGSISRRFSFDGLTVHPGGRVDSGFSAYTHIFRNAGIEAVQVGGGTWRSHNGTQERRLVWARDMSKFFYEFSSKLIDVTRRLGFEGPALLGFGLLSVQGYELGVEDGFYRFHQASADRPDLVPPDVWIERLDTVAVDDITRPVLDVFWQSFGFDRCPHFDPESGAFVLKG